MTEHETEPPPEAPAKPLRIWGVTRRRYLIFAAGLCGLAYVGNQCYQAYRQGQSAAAVRALGGRVIYADEMPHARLAWPRDWINARLGHDYAAPVVAVDLGHTSVRDRDLVLLSWLKHLHALWLQNTHVTDDGLQALQACRKLEELSLRDTQIGDDGLARLAELQSLRFLYLHDTNVSDAGIKHLAALKDLRILCIPSTKITRQGATQLRRLLPQAQIKY